MHAPSLGAGQSLDQASYHAGCPVLGGEKWLGTKWVRVQPFALPDSRRRVAQEGQGQRGRRRQQQQRQQGGWAGRGGSIGRGGPPRQGGSGSWVGREVGCRDMHEQCTRWAAAGECEQNPRYMVGSAQRAGLCRRACGACSEADLRR
jgi:prolyl 4-hydroxylase